MKQWIRLMTTEMYLVMAMGCAESQAVVDTDLGIIPIGSKPESLKYFVSSDCGRLPQGYADCSAQDAYGRRYAFFDGGLSRVWVTRGEASKNPRLPAGVEFGEDIETAAEKIERAFRVGLDRGKSHDGRTVYSSDFAIRSSVGVMYAIDLIADDEGRLSEIVARTDF